MKKAFFILSLCILVVLVVLQITILLPQIARDLHEIQKNYWQPSIWRSVNYAANQSLADYISFINIEVPPNGTVLIPPQGLAPKFLSHSLMMSFALFPRNIVNCNDSSGECAASFAFHDVYILLLDDYPPASVLEDSTRIRWFDEKRGLYLPQNSNSPQIQKTFEPSLHTSEIAKQSMLFLVWLFPLLYFGIVAMKFIFPEKDFLFIIGSGYGLGLLVLTVDLALASLLNIPLTKWAVIGCSILPLCILYTANLITKMKNPKDKHNLFAITSFSQALSKSDLLWVGIFGLFSLATVIIGVGHSYSQTDELILWGLLGYKIALHNSLAIDSVNYLQKVLYPFHIPLLIAACKILFNDTLPHAKIFFSGYYLSLMIIMFSLLRGRTLWHNLFSGLTTLGIATTPIIFHHATLSYANLPFAYYFFLAICILACLLAKLGKSPQTAFKNYAIPQWMISGLFFAAAAWIRPEGFYFSSATLLIIWILSILLAKQWKLFYALLFASLPLIIYQMLFTFFQRWFSATAEIDFISEDMSIKTISQSLPQVIQNGWNATNSLEILKSFLHQCISIISWGYFGVVLVVSIFLLLLIAKFSSSSKRQAFFLILISGWVYLIGMLFSYYAMSLLPIGKQDLSFWLNVGMERMQMPAIILIWIGVSGLLASQLLPVAISEDNHNA